MFERFKEDIRTVKSKDPAATSTLGIILNSPGLRAIWAYRRHHWLWTHGYKALARYLSTRSRRKFGVEIHPGAQIGRRFMIDHGMGVVIGETTIIGDDCLVYQGVTLGGTGKETGKRHPTLGNNVIVGVGACVLGNITLADGVKVGGGAVVVKDVTEACTMVGVPAHSINETRKAAAVVGGPEAERAITWGMQELFADAAQGRREVLPDPLLISIDSLATRIIELEACLDRLESRSPCGQDTKKRYVSKLFERAGVPYEPGTHEPPGEPEYPAAQESGQAAPKEQDPPDDHASHNTR